MAVNRSITWGSSETLVVFVGNMISILLDVLLGQPEVYHEHFAAVLMRPYQEILRLDVPMDELFGVYVLEPCDDLLANEDHGL